MNETAQVVKVQPVNRVTDGGSVVAEYKHYISGDIHLDEFDGDVDIEGVEITEVDAGYWWKYREKPPVLIKETGLYRVKDKDRKESEHQAYFVGSYLDDEAVLDMRKA